METGGPAGVSYKWGVSDTGEDTKVQYYRLCGHCGKFKGVLFASEKVYVLVFLYFPPFKKGRQKQQSA